MAHAYALCWSWNNIISKEKGPIAILDSDVFLIEPIKLTDILYPHHISNILEGRTHHRGRAFDDFWPAIVLMDMDRLPAPETISWWCGQIEGVPVDVGGQSHHYFHAHPELDIFIIPKRHFWIVDSLDFNPADYEEFYLNGLEKSAPVLHYRSGSNWNNQTKEYHQKKTAWLKGEDWIMDKILTYDGKQVKFCDLKMSDHLEGGEHIFQGHWYEIDTLQFIRDLKVPGNYADVGANIGTHTLFFSLFCQADHVYSFEPHRGAYTKLLQNLAANEIKNCTPYNVALSNEITIGHMFQVTDQAAQSHLSKPSDAPWDKSWPGQSRINDVKVITLDSSAST